MTTQALIYFSTRSETCHRFTEKLGIPATRLPEDGDLTATQPFVLLVPTYGGGHHSGAVPRPVIRFLNRPENQGTAAWCDCRRKYQLWPRLCHRR